MQNLFAEETPWNTPWMKRVLPVVTRIAEHHPERTVFTRFIPARHPEELSGNWRRFYRRCDAIYAPSESMAQLLRDQRMNYNVGIWSRGIDGDIFDPARRDLAWRRARAMTPVAYVRISRVSGKSAARVSHNGGTRPSTTPWASSRPTTPASRCIASR